MTSHGRPYSDTGFSNRFRAWCNEAGLSHCSAHGVRKAGAPIAAERCASEHQLMAIFGWVDPKQAAIYAKKARRKKLAGDAMPLIQTEETEYKKVPLSETMSSGGTKTA